MYIKKDIMNTQPETLFSSELMKGEKILRCGQPDSSIWFTAKDIFMLYLVVLSIKTTKRKIHIMLLPIISVPKT